MTFCMYLLNFRRRHGKGTEQAQAERSPRTDHNDEIQRAGNQSLSQGISKKE